MDLDVGTLDTSQLYEGAERGMEASSLSDIRSREMVAWLQTQVCRVLEIYRRCTNIVNAVALAVKVKVKVKRKKMTTILVLI